MGYLRRGEKEERQKARKVGLPVPGAPLHSALLSTHTSGPCAPQQGASTCKFSLLQGRACRGCSVSPVTLFYSHFVAES